MLRYFEFGRFGEVCVILNDKVGYFKFTEIDNEFYLLLRFGGFNVSIYDVVYYLLVYFIVFMHLILAWKVYSVSIVDIAIFVDVMEILFYLLID